MYSNLFELKSILEPEFTVKEFEKKKIHKIKVTKMRIYQKPIPNKMRLGC